MQFGAFVPQGWRMDLVGIPVERQWDTVVATARVAEDAGFHSVWVYDHFHTVPHPSQESTFEAWTVMAGLAEATETARLGQMCTSNSYRSPAYLAKVTACIDVMSGGRLDVGIGAGWYEHEYLGYGYEFPKPSVRIGQLEEGVEILKAMWTEDSVDYEGRWYRLQGAINRPRPVQEPRPPLWIAGAGEQLTLRVVARHADYANFAGDVATFRHKRAVLDEHCEREGRDRAEIGLSRNWDCVIGEDGGEIDAKLARVAKTVSDVEGWRKRALVGTAAEITEELAFWKDEGVDYGIVYFMDATWGDGMRHFGAEVVPALA